MARAKDHIELASRNQRALAYLLLADGKFPEWVVTVAFYKAVHIVEAVFQKEGLNASTGHSERLRTLKRDRRFTKMHEHFRPLWQASTIARYLSNETGNDYRRFTDYMSAQDAENKMVRHRLHQLEESALGFLGPVGSELERAIPRTN